MPDASYQSGVYRQQGGNNLVIGTGGTITFDEGGNVARLLRTRVTVAQINAGLTLLAAVVGKAYRLHHAAAIAIGGNAGAVTTVDLKATQGASGVSLVAWAQASLTRSAVLVAGATGAAVLADGASFVANDANTAITIIKAGADVTVATHIDVLLSYTLE